jgi:hypothetical protein
VISLVASVGSCGGNFGWKAAITTASINQMEVLFGNAIAPAFPILGV